MRGRAVQPHPVRLFGPFKPELDLVGVGMALRATMHPSLPVTCPAQSPNNMRRLDRSGFMALIVYRVIRQRLKLAKSDLSPEKALAQLRRIQRHRVSINQAAPVSGISTINTLQAGVLAALNLKQPTEETQRPLL